MMTECSYKVLIIGDTKVGKTSMVMRYTSNKWLNSVKPTIGADFAVKVVQWSSSETVKLHLWDIAGQEHFRAMTRTYYRGASGCVVMFDVTNRETYQHARDWKYDLDSKVVLPNGQPVPCILLANKDDVDAKLVTPIEVQKFARDNGFFYWGFISVKENRNVDESIRQLIQAMLQQDQISGQSQEAEERVESTSSEDNHTTQRSCC